MNGQTVSQIYLEDVKHPEDNPRQDAIGFNRNFLEDYQSVSN